mmetsp:Transcript_71230/g.197816  ORF Transcript_71230/g.197816 Transcript_71230/m.197816 type:complete len:293 (-) Transcript_71230:350-1228(-)
MVWPFLLDRLLAALEAREVVRVFLDSLLPQRPQRPNGFLFRRCNLGGNDLPVEPDSKCHLCRRRFRRSRRPGRLHLGGKGLGAGTGLLVADEARRDSGLAPRDLPLALLHPEFLELLVDGRKRCCRAPLVFFAFRVVDQPQSVYLKLLHLEIQPGQLLWFPAVPGAEFVEFAAALVQIVSCPAPVGNGLRNVEFLVWVRLVSFDQWLLEVLHRVAISPRGPFDTSVCELNGLLLLHAQTMLLPLIFRSALFVLPLLGRLCVEGLEQVAKALAVFAARPNNVGVGPRLPGQRL